MTLNTNTQKNLEEIIDILIDNLAYAWRYYNVLDSIHEEAKSKNSIVDSFPHFLECVWYAFFDALFLKLNHFIDRTKNSYSFIRLFKKIKKYYPNDKVIIKKIHEDENRLNKEAYPIINKIENWRKQLVAHLTPSFNDQTFYEKYKMHLDEVRGFLEFCQETLNYYSEAVLGRPIGDVSDILDYSDILDCKKDITNLFNAARPNQSLKQTGNN